MQLTIDFRHRTYRHGHNYGVKHKGGQLAAGHLPAKHIDTAAVEHKADAGKADKDHKCDKKRALHNAFFSHREGLVDLAVKGGQLGTLAIKAVHGFNILHHLTGIGADIGNGIL